VQATFLLLARKAATVHTAVGPWLYRVAGRTASRLRRAVRRLEPLPELPAATGLPADVRAVLADELARLPEAYRLVVELCYVAGHSTAEAADRLGWPKGTVLTRLAWARKRLRANLTRRGVTLGGSLAAVLLDREAAHGGRATLGSESSRVLSLCDGVARAMTLTKLLWGAGLAAVAAGGLGVGALAVGQVPAAKTPTTAPRKAEPPPPQADALPPPESQRIPPQDEPVLIAPPTEPTRSMLPPPADKPGRSFTVTGPAGAYVREFADGERFALRFDADRLFVEASFGDKAKPATLTLDADYALNKEGVVFGVITGAEYDGPDQGRGLAALAPLLAGEPFAFRVRADDGSVSVKDLRLLGLNLPQGRNAEPEVVAALAAVAGRYTATKELPPTARKGGKPKLPRLGVPDRVDVIRPADVPSTIPPNPTTEPATPPRAVPTLPSPTGGGPPVPTLPKTT
jgi:hypothetical protein